MHIFPAKVWILAGTFAIFDPDNHYIAYETFSNILYKQGENVRRIRG